MNLDLIQKLQAIFTNDIPTDFYETRYEKFMSDIIHHSSTPIRWDSSSSSKSFKSSTLLELASKVGITNDKLYKCGYHPLLSFNVTKFTASHISDLKDYTYTPLPKSDSPVELFLLDTMCPIKEKWEGTSYNICMTFREINMCASNIILLDAMRINYKNIMEHVQERNTKIQKLLTSYTTLLDVQPKEK